MYKNDTKPINDGLLNLNHPLKRSIPAEYNPILIPENQYNPPNNSTNITDPPNNYTNINDQPL
jgi:hypothetical protein